MMSVIMLRVAFYLLYSECRYAACHYAKCHYAECHNAKYRGAVKSLIVHASGLKFLVINTLQNKLRS